MFARFVDLAKKHQQRLAYLVTAGFLACVFEAGHITHWNFGLFEAVRGAARPVSRTASPTASAELSEVVTLSPEIVAKTGIAVEPATTRIMRQTITVNGETAYDQEAVAQLSVRAAGHVWRIEKRAGQEVKKGDCLAIIDAVAVGEAKSDFLQAVVDEKLKRKMYERISTLTSEVAERTKQQAEADWREAHIQLLSAQQKLLNFGMFLPLSEIGDYDEDELTLRVRLLGLPESIRATLDPLTTTANLIPLAAPFDGIVISRDVSLGEVVSPEHSQFVVADVGRMWILLDVRKDAADLVRIGQPIEFRVDGSHEPVIGKIDWISTALDPQTRTLQVRAEVLNPPVDGHRDGTAVRRLKAHNFGVGRIVLRETPEAVVVPATAVQADAFGSFVFVREDRGFVRRNVRTGVAEPDVVEITAGIQAGEFVVSHGSHALKAELAEAASR